jgi:hypothetical protein
MGHRLDSGHEKQELKVIGQTAVVSSAIAAV